MQRTTLLLTILLAAGLAGCERETRDFRVSPPGNAPSDPVRLSALQPGVPLRDASLATYQENAWAMSEGYRLFNQFNCAGCHSPGGGGGIGPPLIDQEWIYGSAPENVFQTIQEGRPNGMPSFKGRISSADTWKLVVYVRSMSELTSADMWPGRADAMEEANPEPQEGKMQEASEVSEPRRRR